MVRWSGSRRVIRWVAAAALTVGLVAVPPVAAPAAAAAEPGCQDVLLLGARGSGQPQAGNRDDGQSGLGPQVASASRRLHFDLRSRRTLAVLPLQYPARHVRELADPRVYFNGVAEGVSNAQTALLVRARRCPDERIVLAGYSQGAMVVHRVLRRLEHEAVRSASYRAILSRVDGAVLIADGDKVAYDRVRHYGTGGPRARGVAVATPTLQRASGADPRPLGTVGARVHSVCTRTDPVCDSSGNPVSDVARHVSVHLGYTATVSLHLAVDQAARQVWSTALARPRSTSHAHTVGEPVDLQLRVAPLPPGYAPEWAIASGALPAGLALHPAGRITGSMGEAGSRSVDLRVRSVAPDGSRGTWTPARVSFTASAPPPPVQPSQDDLPLPPDAAEAPNPSVQDVSCARDHCAAVVEYDVSGGGSGREGMALLHHDGTAWTATKAELGWNLTMIDLSCGGDTCMAVGIHETDPSRLSQVPAVFAWSSGQWRTIAVEVPPGPADDPVDYAQMLQVSCPATGFCIAAGLSVLASADDRSLVLEWRGEGRVAAHELPLPAGADPRTWLHSLGCTDRDACVAVGSYLSRAGQRVPYSMRLTPQGWTSAALPAGSVGKLENLSCGNQGICLTTGDAATGSLLRFEGGAWTTEQAPVAIALTLDCVDGGTCWLHGLSDAATHVLLRRQPGGAWREVVLPDVAYAWRLACTPGPACLLAGISASPSFGWHTGFAAAGGWTPLATPSWNGTPGIGWRLDCSSTRCAVLGPHRDGSRVVGAWAVLVPVPR